MTNSRKCNDTLMCLASPNVDPVAPVLPTRSDPARSTIWSLDRRTVGPPAARLSMYTVKMQCEREEWAFMEVSATARLVSPIRSKPSAASSEVATCEERPRT
eukprot:scaffold8427_cov96-Isochrysis_galbana.AAC.1